GHLLRDHIEPVGLDSGPGQNADDDDDPNADLGLNIHVRCSLTVLCRSRRLSSDKGWELNGAPPHEKVAWKVRAWDISEDSYITAPLARCGWSSGHSRAPERGVHAASTCNRQRARTIPAPQHLGH